MEAESCRRAKAIAEGYVRTCYTVRACCMSLTVVRPSLAARLTGYEAIEEVIMPLRIRRHDKSLYGRK